jgi:hypothetical protein
MNSKRFLKLFVVSAVALAVLVTLQAFRSPVIVENSVAGYTGMGEFQRLEAQETIPQPVGIGDLRHFEAQQIIPVTGAPHKSSRKIGMGDLHLFEVKNRSVTSLGELRQFEAAQ